MTHNISTISDDFFNINSSDSNNGKHIKCIEDGISFFYNGKDYDLSNINVFDLFGFNITLDITPDEFEKLARKIIQLELDFADVDAEEISDDDIITFAASTLIFQIMTAHVIHRFFNNDPKRLYPILFVIEYAFFVGLESSNMVHEKITNEEADRVNEFSQSRNDTIERIFGQNQNKLFRKNGKPIFGDLESPDSSD